MCIYTYPEILNNYINNNVRLKWIAEYIIENK